MTKEEHKERKRKYRDNNKEKIKEYNKKYRDDNKEIIKERKRKYNQDNKEHIKEHLRKYRENLPDAYVKYVLTKQGFTKQDIKDHPELIEFNRELIRLKRLTWNKS